MLRQKDGTEANGKRAEKRRGQDVRQLIPPLGLTEYWYPALQDRKVGKKPVGLKLLGEQLVFFRGGDGQVKALSNVCPHRAGSLMHGDCHYPGTISCPYHGWTYDGDGNVLAVLPEGPESAIPGKVKAHVYPTRTLRGMVFIWMGEGEPAAIEEDVPPDFFRDDGLILYAWEVWPVNWRVAVENAGDAHVPYVHRDAALILMAPLSLNGPRGAQSEEINGRAVRFASKMSAFAASPTGKMPSMRSVTPDPASETGNQENGVRSGKPVPARRPPKYREYFPLLKASWPKHWYRGLWVWLFRWSVKRRYSKPCIDTTEEWGGLLHHLPAMVRLDYHTHIYTRANVPIDANNTREIYFHFARGNNWFARLYEKLHFHLYHRWALYTNFSIQDFKAAGPQRYDTDEYLSATDSQLIAWRRLATRARGREKVRADEVLPPTPAEEFAHQRQVELGVIPSETVPTPVDAGQRRSGLH